MSSVAGAPQQSKIPFRFKVPPEAINANEDWTGKTDRNARRKLQNRLNQRVSRRRRAIETQQLDQTSTSQAQLPIRWIRFDVDEASAPLERTLVAPEPPWAAHTSSSDDGFPSKVSVAIDTGGVVMPLFVENGTLSDAVTGPISQSLCRKFENDMTNMRVEMSRIIPDEFDQTDNTLVPGESKAVQFEEILLKLLDVRSNFPLSADHLMSLIYYNVFRALVRNIRALNIDLELMKHDDYLSPFLTGSAKNLPLIPPELRPTPIQQTIPHHPCFDIFPDAILRDNAIVNQAGLHKARLCFAVAGKDTYHENDLTKRVGMVVWGEPEYTSSWEITEGFAGNWPWMLRGALSLEVGTNLWRAQRGEDPIYFA